MALSISVAAALAACNTVTALVEAGTTNSAPKFTVYSGPVPANVGAALDPSNLELVTMEMSPDAFQDAVDSTNSAVASANAIVDTPALADGTATFYRIFDRDDNAIWQGTVSEPNAGGDMQLSSVSVVQNVNVRVQSFNFRTFK